MNLLGGSEMRNEFSNEDISSSIFDVPLRKPSKALFFGGFSSVAVGILISLWGLKSIGTASNTKEYELGFLGYLFTALVPIILLQVIFSSHKNSVTNNHDVPYDIYAGNLNIARFKKIVLVGLISAAMPIWVFFYPIAEKFV